MRLMVMTSSLEGERGMRRPTLSTRLTRWCGSLQGTSPLFSLDVLSRFYRHVCFGSYFSIDEIDHLEPLVTILPSQ
jgi:hypothetical protein